eukprot:15253968-Alexandrium_andersonii.AAC.1
MSASLVGSEMCIRDSVSPASSAWRRSLESPLWPRRRATPGPGRIPSAVSYTHLTLPTICSV